MLTFLGWPAAGETPRGLPPEASSDAVTAQPHLNCQVYQVDPLVCSRCGQRMSLIAFVTDQMTIGRILDHLGLEAEKPPPPVRELLRVAEHADGWGVPAHWDSA